MHPVFLVIVIIPGAILPLLWMYRLRNRDRVISPRKYFYGASAHIMICLGLAVYPKSLALYSLLLLGLISLSLIPQLQSEAHYRLRIAEKDIAKLQRLLEHHAGNAAMHLALGDAYYNFRLYDQAIAEYALAAQLDDGLRRAVKGKTKNAQLEKIQQDNENLPIARWFASIKLLSGKRKAGMVSEERDKRRD